MLCAIPIEIAARELDGVLYLALHLAARGLPTLLGERMVNQYVLSSRKPVVYFDSDQDLSVNEAVLAAGGRVVNLKPEGLNQWDRVEVVDNLLRILPCVTRICAWGERQAALLRARMPQDKAGLVAVTGYPSFDLAHRDFLPYYRDEDLVRHAEMVGKSLRHGIEALGHPLIDHVRGRGLLLGVALTAPLAKEAEAGARAAGFLINAPAPDVLRLAPPLIITEAQADSFVAALPGILDAAGTPA